MLIAEEDAGEMLIDVVEGGLSEDEDDAPVVETVSGLVGDDDDDDDDEVVVVVVVVLLVLDNRVLLTSRGR